MKQKRKIIECEEIYAYIVLFANNVILSLLVKCKKLRTFRSSSLAYAIYMCMSVYNGCLLALVSIEIKEKTKKHTQHTT